MGKKNNTQLFSILLRRFHENHIWNTFCINYIDEYTKFEYMSCALKILFWALALIISIRTLFKMRENSIENIW